MTDYDLCVIGGGVNGAGIARDAAGRGLSVILVEAQDLAGATSSASTKLIHGGLRYLEHYEFRLVDESLREREVLLKAAPHIIWPMQFILPHDQHLRPYWLIKAGLTLYDFLGGKKTLPKSEALDFATASVADPLKDSYTRGFSYSDCWVEDSRLVVLNAMDAYERGAVVMPRTACLHLETSKSKKAWIVHLQNMLNNDQFQITAKMVVNAAGPWVRSILDSSELTQKQDDVPHVRLVKGSHVVLQKLYEGDQSYILQQTDGRIIFTIPYENKFTLVGTTDVPFNGDASQVTIEQEEIDYLLKAVNQSFKKQITVEDIIWTYSGVRSLLDDGKETISKVTRDYKLYVDERHGPPILSVFGGKITTYRKLSEEVIDRISTFYPMRKMPAWTEYVPLPGGDIEESFNIFVENQKKTYPFLPKDLINRYARAYGTRMNILLKNVKDIDQMGTHFGDNLYEAEVRYLIKYEFAHTIDDILMRRSKLGLHLSKRTIDLLEKTIPTLVKIISTQQDRYENASGH
jgi:glycerol-3-phosphate dehydrogenase